MFQEGIEPGTSPTPDCINLKETRPLLSYLMIMFEIMQRRRTSLKAGGAQG